MTRLSKPDDCSSDVLILAEVASQFDWTERTTSKPCSFQTWFNMRTCDDTNFKIGECFLVSVPDVSTLVWSNEMFTMMLHFWLQATSSVESQRPLTGEGWMFKSAGVKSARCQKEREFESRMNFQEDSQTWRRSFTSCMVVIFHSMWVVHLQLIPLLKTSSRLVRPHCLDSSDLFYFIKFFFPRLNLSSAWKPVFAKVSLRSKWISSLTGCDLKCLWAESELCVQSLSLSFFPSPG